MIYPADTFKRAQKYGTTILVTADEKLNDYLHKMMAQVEGKKFFAAILRKSDFLQFSDWLTTKTLQKLIVIIAAIETGEIVERWQFDIVASAEDDQPESEEPGTSTKSEKKIAQEITDVIRQITASVTFLPLLETPCMFRNIDF